MKKIFTLLAGLMMLWSCGRNEITITHLPFKADVDDRWGLIGSDGKILFENEFENQPSHVINGIFFVQNTDGLYEYYTADKKPKRIGDKAYVNAGYFIEDVAPVVESERHISFIRRDGSHAFTLDYYKDEEIIYVGAFSDDRAEIRLKSGKRGFIDAKGNVVIAPQFVRTGGFSEGMAVVRETNTTAYVINTEGKKQFDLKAKPDKDGNIPWFGQFHDGLIACKSGEPESDVIWTTHYLDKKGDKAFNVPSKMDMVGNFSKGYAICSKWSDDHKAYLGVINRQGEIIIRPKYDATEFMGSEPDFAGYMGDGFACIPDKGKFGLIDMKDNVICPFQFDAIFPFYNCKYAFAKERDAYHLIDKKGSEVDKKEYAVVEEYDPYRVWITSDYLDISDALSAFFGRCRDKQVGPIALDEKVEQLIKDFNMEPNKKALSGQHIASFSEASTPGYTATYEAHFNMPVVSPITSGYWWDSKTVGYTFNTEAKINVIVVDIDLKVLINDQINRIDKSVRNYLTSTGYRHIDSGKWNKMQVDVFRKSDDQPTVSISRPTYDNGNFKIIFGLTNN